MINMDDPIYSSEKKVAEWYSYLNYSVSVWCFSLALASLSLSPYTQELASLCFIFVSIFCFAKGSKLALHHRRLDRIKGKTINNLEAIFGSLLFMVSLGFLLSVAAGLKAEQFVGFSLTEMLSIP